jgi:hypothetical protein
MTYFNEIAGYAPPLVYLHIPKTAGQALIATLCKYFPPSDALALYLESNEMISSMSGFEYKLGTPVMPRLIVGHFNYGVPQRILGHMAYRWITFLRHPYTRTLSNYFFDRDYLFNSELENERNLKEFIFSVNPESYINEVNDWKYDNCMTRMLAGVGATVPLGCIDHSILDMAKINLSTFFYVGFQENYSNSLMNLGKKIGISNIVEFKKNQMCQKTIKESGHLNELNVFSIPTERNIFDLQLYYWALQKFELNTTGLKDEH